MRFIWGVLVGRDVRTGADLETGRGTHAVGQVSDQVADGDIAVLKFTVQPACVWSATWHREWLSPVVGSDAHHLVNVFCWTLTHCSSKGAILSGCEHRCRQKLRVLSVGIGVRIWYACSCVLVVVFPCPKQWMRGCWLDSLAGAADPAVFAGRDPCQCFEAVRLSLAQGFTLSSKPSPVVVDISLTFCDRVQHSFIFGNCSP
jgi:hypothetical protein